MKRSKHTLLWGLFWVYCVMMVYLLFWQRVGRANYSSYWDVLGTNLNLIPFRTIQEFLSAMGRGLERNQEALVRISIVNLLGNVLMFVPLGLFLPCLWPRLCAFRFFMTRVTAIILMIEVVQLFTLLGSCDIDDMILNVLGAAIGCWIYKLFSAMRKIRGCPPLRTMFIPNQSHCEGSKIRMRIGMIGGVGPESTVDYYKRLIELCQNYTQDENYPEIIINSINMTAMLQLVAEKRWSALTQMLTHAVNSLQRAGADFAFIASNTPHIVFADVKRASPIPLVSIVEAVRMETQKHGLKKVCLLGTLFTMQSSYYQTEFAGSGITIIVPNEKEQQYIQEKLFSEIERGIFLEETRNGLLSIVKRLILEEAIDGVILGCTELPLILTQSEYGIRFLNTTEIHASQVVEKYKELAVL